MDAQSNEMTERYWQPEAGHSVSQTITITATTTVTITISTSSRFRAIYGYLRMCKLFKLYLYIYINNIY